MDNTIRALEETVDSVNNGQMCNNNIDKLMDMMMKDDVTSTDKTVDILNKMVHNSINKDGETKVKLEKIDTLRNTINSKFMYKSSLCKEYLKEYEVNSSRDVKLYKDYDGNLLDMVTQIQNYNNILDNLIHQYYLNICEHQKNRNMLEPNTYIVQMVVSMIVLRNLKVKNNILYKQKLINELQHQISYLDTMEVYNKNKNNLDNLLLNEMGDINTIMDSVGKNNNNKSVEDKDILISNLINNI
tara:strand:+ start:3418 stop:4146 length:729 start_codon:yes stop_codon:yes gene_type:complete